MNRLLLILFLLSFCLSSKAQSSCPDNHHPHMIDLGLPSGTKWACCNVGASRPEEYGGYYAWGETEEKDYYDWDTYKWCLGDKKTMTKYCTNSVYGTVDNKETLSATDDVAQVKWGGNWRMPTGAEKEELCTECRWTWTTKNGVKGVKMVGPNGNSIFLPAAGCRRKEELSDAGSSCDYWSSSLYESRSFIACLLYFDPRGVFCFSFNTRCSGHSVRAVCP